MRLSIGCDVGGSSIKAALLAASRPRRSLEVATPAGRGELIDAICGLVLRLVEESSTRGHAPPGAVGIGFCGLLDARRRSIVRSTHLPELNGCRLASSVERRTRLPVILDADTNAGAVAEATLGAGRGFSRVLYVTLGTGLGAALVVDREPVRASHHTVGQISEIRLRDVGPGSRDSRAEDLLSGRGILARARREGIRGATSTLDLFTLARQGDTAARGVWREVGQILGRLLHTLVSLWSPDVVITAGGTAGAAELFLPAAERELALSMRGRPPPSLRTPARGRFAGAIGAALLARRAVSPEA
jgi:glucokinase